MGHISIRESALSNLNVQPTIKISIGYRFNVRVNRDILFDAAYTPLSTIR